MFAFTVLLTLSVAFWDDPVGEIQPFLSSFIRHVTHEDTNDVTIVISVSPKHATAVKKMLNEQFSSQVDSGLVHLISPTKDYTKAFTKLPPLSKSFSHRVTEFNEKTGFLLYYASQLSEYTLHLTEQSAVTDRFLPDVKQYIDQYKNSSYFALTFNDWWLMHSSVMYNMNEFYTMFGHHATPGILNTYRVIKVSKSLVNTKSKIFSFRPIASCKQPKSTLETNMAAHPGDNYFFWASTPKKDDYMQITFDATSKLSRVQIAAGTHYFADLPKMALLKACAVTEDKKSCNTSNCHQITTVGDPVQDIAGLEDIIGFHVKCLRLEFMEKGHEWVMIRDIAACIH